MNGINHFLLHSTTSFCRYTGIHRLLRPIFTGWGVILVLHRVVPESSSPRIRANARIEITPEFLEKLILFFQQRGYEFISLDEVYQRLSTRTKGQFFICFTFDDGYTDAYDVVYPIFKKHQIPYAIYVITSFPDKDITLWWYMLEDLVLHHDSITFTWDKQDYYFKATHMKDKERTFIMIRELILKTAQDQFDDIISAIFSPYDIQAEDYADHQMNWQQVSKLSDDPLVTIGAHTVHHYNLKKLSSLQVKEEIVNSKKILEDKTAQPVTHFSYPYGSRNEVGRREFDIAAGCGFKTMTTVREGCIFHSHNSYLESLPRVEITGNHQDITFIDMRLCGAVSLLRNGLCRVITE